MEHQLTTKQELSNENERRREVAGALRELIAIVNSGQSINDILVSIAMQARKLLRSAASAIHVPVSNAGMEMLAVRASDGLDEEYASVLVPDRISVTGLAFSLVRPVAANDILEIVSKERSDLLEPEYEEQGSHLRVLRL